MKESSEDSSSTNIQKREQEVRSKLDDEIKSCETRRVTDKTVKCVQQASTTQELETCLR